METSDSECFESADEDFEDDFNRNKLDKNLATKSILSKNSETEPNIVHVLPDINRNKKKDKNSKTSPIEKLQDSINEDSITTENLRVNAPAPAFELGEVNKSILKSVEQLHDVSDSDLRDNTGDNLWNEGEGWGVSDESDKDESVIIQTVTNSDKIHNDDQKNTNLRELSKLETSEEKNMWDTEEWVTVNEEKAKRNNIELDIGSQNSNSNQLWKGWGNWGVNSILSTATQSVSTLTNSVSQGLSTVLETSIGAPDPEKLAMINHTATELPTPTKISSNTDDECENKNLLGFGLSNIGNLVSGVSKLVESTGSKVISGGLGTLETIGKKTMEVIQDGDPGLKRKRAFLNLEGEKPVLSQVLRDAKEKAEQENKILQEKHIKKVNYESIFDDHQGLVHLEALEMLSKQCDMKLQSLIESNSGNTLVEIQETLDQVKELCELPDEEEEEQISIEELKAKLKTAVGEIDINISYEKLINMWEETECWLNNINLNICDEDEIHEQAVETLAQLTALAVEQFHKAGELLLIKDHHSTADEADSLVQLTTLLTSLIGIVAAKFSDKMNSKVTENSNKENINSLITNIFFEAANSSSYIQDAFQLLVPVLQMGAV